MKYLLIITLLISSQIVTSQNRDTTTIEYEMYQVKTIPANEPGEIITIRDKKSGHIFKVEGGNFMGINDYYLMVDFGTSPSRGLTIYNLKTDKVVYSLDYEAPSLIIKDNKIHFKTKVEIPDPKKRPHCSKKFEKIHEDEIGYVEEQILILKDLKLIKTGKYECWMFQ